MIADDLQRWASILRWVGLSVTAVGLLITFGSHYIADKLLVVQRADKAAAQERLKASEAKTAELAARLAPRVLTEQQRDGFAKFVEGAPHGPVKIFCITNNTEAAAYAFEIRSLLQAAGFNVIGNTRLFMASGLRATGVTLAVKGSENAPVHAAVIQKGFEAIGISSPGGAAHPTEEFDDDTVAVYVGEKR